MQPTQKKVLATIAIAAAVPLTLAACGSSLKTTLRNDYNKEMTKARKQIAQGHKNASPLRYCRATDTRRLLPKQAPGFAYVQEDQVSRLTGSNVGKIVGSNPAGPVLAIVPATEYTHGSGLGGLHHLVSKGDAKIIPVNWTKKGGQTTPSDAFVWTGPADMIQTSSFNLFAVNGAHFENGSFQRVSAICGGALTATKVKSYTKPGTNASGTTTTTATMTFTYKKVPSWLKSSKRHILVPMKTVKETEAGASAGNANSYIRSVENKMAGVGKYSGKNKKQPKALNPAAVLPGKVRFAKTNNGWTMKKMSIPALEGAFAQEAMKLSGL